MCLINILHFCSVSPLSLEFNPLHHVSLRKLTYPETHSALDALSCFAGLGPAAEQSTAFLFDDLF